MLCRARAMSDEHCHTAEDCFINLISCGDERLTNNLTRVCIRIDDENPVSTDWCRWWKVCGMVHGEPPRVKNIGRHDSPRGSDERLWRGCGVNRFPRKRRRQLRKARRQCILSRFLKTAAFNRKLHGTAIQTGGRSIRASRSASLSRGRGAVRCRRFYAHSDARTFAPSGSDNPLPQTLDPRCTFALTTCAGATGSSVVSASVGATVPDTAHRASSDRPAAPSSRGPSSRSVSIRRRGRTSARSDQACPTSAPPHMAMLARTTQSTRDAVKESCSLTTPVVDNAIIGRKIITVSRAAPAGLRPGGLRAVPLPVARDQGRRSPLARKAGGEWAIRVRRG